MNALSRPNPVATVSVFLTPGWEARRRLAEKNERSARRWESGGKARQVTNAHHRLARSRAPNGRKRPVQRTASSCAGPSTRGRVVGLKEQPANEFSGSARDGYGRLSRMLMLSDSEFSGTE